MSEMTVRESNLPVFPSANTLEQTITIGRIYAKSGYFRDATDEAKAVVKIMAGAELGVPPVASMKGIHIIEGKPSFSAGLMAGVAHRAGYWYEVLESNDKTARLEFHGPRGGKIVRLGVAEFTMAMATRAGLAVKDNWKKYPESMLLARAISRGVNMFCQGVFLGPVYTPEELGANVNGETGDIIPEPYSNLPRPASPLRVVSAETVDADGVIKGEMVDETQPEPPAAAAKKAPASPSSRLRSAVRKVWDKAELELNYGAVCTALRVECEADSEEEAELESFNDAGLIRMLRYAMIGQPMMPDAILPLPEEVLAEAKEFLGR